MRNYVLTLITAGVLALAPSLAGPARADQCAEEVPLPHQQWSFEGPLGTYDETALQHGFQVYKEVCSACHALKHLAYRDLTEIGYTDDQVKGFAAQFQVTDGPNDQGQMFQRPARPSDAFVPPFPNDQAARVANNGALPPDMSLLVKAREGGPDYVYGIVTGFKDAPANCKLGANMYWNEHFPGHQIAMPPPLTTDGQVTYADGTKPTIQKMAADVTTFLAWASEPNLNERHRMGVKVILFLLVAAGLFYAAKRRIWAKIH
ncbi:MAG TPA: cytochrome c1 [Stellaceae bacterium]|nr:cytochrome c1 [Stellaceae bacterium]